MTLNDLMVLFNNLVGETYALSAGSIPSDLLVWFNECSRDIVNEARYGKSTAAAYDEETPTVALPADIHKLPDEGLWYNDEVINEVPWRDTSSTGYKRWGDTLTIQELSEVTDETFTVYYYAALPAFTGVSTEAPVIPAVFQDIYAIFAAMKYQQSQLEISELELKRDFQMDYEKRKAELDLFTLQRDSMSYTTTRDEM